MLFFILSLSIYAVADGDSSAVAALDDNKEPGGAVFPSIPLPRQTAYIGEGLSFGIGAGLFIPTTDCDCMGAWQVQFEYFYKPWLSGGLDVRFFGGNLDEDVMVMYQRYRLNVRGHMVMQAVDFYAEPVFGFENTSISEFRHQYKTHTSHSSNLLTQGRDSTENDVESCEKMFSLDGFSMGLGTGFGLKMLTLFALTGDLLVEYNFSRAVLLSATPGIAFNLREFIPWAQKRLRSTWISLETTAQRYFNRGVNDWSVSVYMGLQLGI